MCRLLTARWVEKLLSSDVSKESLGTRPALKALFWLRCWSETEQKQRVLISQTQLVTVSLLSSSSWNSPFDPTWPPVTILLTLTRRFFSSCSRDCDNPNIYMYKSFAPYLIGFYSFMSKFRICLSTIFCVAWSAVCTFKPFISSQFIENSIYYSFSLAGWYNCPKAKTWSVFAIQCIKTACESLLQGH